MPREKSFAKHKRQYMTLHYKELREKFFKKSRNTLEYNFGMSLSLLELFALKEIVGRGISITANSTETGLEFYAVSVFLNEFYDLPQNYRPMIGTFMGIIDKPFVEYLNRKREGVFLL